MADDRIEVEIVLDDGSIQKGFANIRSEGQKTGRSLSRALSLGRADIAKPLRGITDSVIGTRVAFASLGTVLAGGAFFASAASAASQQQEAVNALNVSLKTAGSFSNEASESFQKLASELQAQSRFGDEVILQQAALARNYARSNEEAERLVAVSIDLAEATGISLDSAVRNLGKTFSGLQGELGESIPALRNLTAEQLKAGGALDLIADRFSGSALGATRTFSGALTQLRNTVGDLFESFGATITNSPQIIAFFNALSQTIQGVISGFQGGGSSFDSFFKGLVINSAAAVNAVIDSFEFVSQIPDFFRFAFLQVQIATLSFVNEFFKLIEPVSGFIDRIFGDAGASRAAIQQNEAVLAGLNAQLDELGQSSIRGGEGFQFARKAVEDFTTTFQELSIANNTPAVDAPDIGGGGGLGGTSVATVIDNDLEKLRNNVMKLQMETQTAINDTFFNNEAVLGDTPSVFEDLSQKGTSSLQAVQAELTRTRDQAVQLSQQVGQAVKNGIANTISNSVSSVVEALRTGQDAFGAFAKAALATIGDLAVQLGTTLIASGIGIEALKVLGGAAAIAAGIALVAVGTLIKGAAGGGAPNVSGGSSVTPPLADLEPDGVSDELNDPESRVNVTINGSVFDDAESIAIRLGDIFKDEGFQNAVIA